MENPTEHFDEIVIEPPTGWLNLELNELFRYHELLFFLIWRDVMVRYKQTILGAGWAIIQPLVTMGIFSVIFGRLANLPTDGIPYPIFSYTALLPWQLFSRALTDASGSLTNNQSFITKIYFPKLFLPMSSVLGGLVDFAIAMVILFVMMFFYKIPLSPRILVLPGLIAFALVTSMAIALWLAPLNVKYRDVKYVLPFLVQGWMYITPVAYSSSLIPENWRVLYGINPLAGVVEGFRWALLGQEISVGPLILVSVLIVIPIFVGGLFYFRRMERTFSDVI